ncbi:unnamed protein product [Phytophthora fragariaefolia]|uniref:Unnamed protein product n=1 Tax=Phytophthora fragariaefolia TaxID=1490495 RepID=A0A9W6XP11_9STRA|nr:unnamed protein product [Phytophthora fragariaefolia]
MLRTRLVTSGMWLQSASCAAAQRAAGLNLSALASECWLGELKVRPCVRSSAQAGASCNSHFCIYNQVDKRNTLGNNLTEVPASPTVLAFSSVTYHKEFFSSAKVKMLISTRSSPTPSALSTTDTSRTSSVPITLFMPLAAPQLKSTSHTALVQRRKLRREYEDEVAMRCNNDADIMAEVVVSVKKSYNKRLLEVWCEFDWDVDIETVSDEFIVNKVDEIISSVKNNSVPDVAAVFKENVSMDMAENDVKERVMQFFARSKEFIEEQGWKEFFTRDEGLRLKCKLLVESLQPRSLRDEVATIIKQLEQLAQQTVEAGDDLNDFDDEFCIGATPNSEVRQAVEEMITRALENGFPAEKEDRLRTGAAWMGLRECLKSLGMSGTADKKPRQRRVSNDYRPLNSNTEPIAGVMPILQVITENVRGMCFFGLLDFVKGYWQLPLAKASQELLSYMTDAKVYTPPRAPQGCYDAALHFQMTMEHCFAKLLYRHLLIWIDDLLLYAEDTDTYLEKLSELFALMNDFGLKLSASKSSLFQRSVKWCDKIIDGVGVRHDPKRVETLRKMPLPSNAGELQQFLCACNSKLPVIFTNAERTAFDQVKACLANSATLAYPSPDGVTSVYTDASDEAWSVIVTDEESWDSKKPIADQKHRLLHCLSGTFSGSQENWSLIEKEAYAIVAACDKLPHLLLRPAGFRLFCDHRNLIHLFAPDEMVKKHFRGKFLDGQCASVSFGMIFTT